MAADEPAPDEVAWLSPEQLRDWRSVMGLLMTLPAALDAQLRVDSDLNLFEYHVLAALSDVPEATRGMTELAAVSQGSLSRLSHAVGRLERAGYVERTACSASRRRMEARLTESGRRKLEEAAPGHVREVRRLVVDTVTPQDLAALGSAARAVLAVIDPDLVRHLAAPLD